MVKLLAREFGLVLLTGLFARFAFPLLVRIPGSGELFWVGVVMAMAFGGVYALAVLAGNKMPVRVRNWVGPLAWAGAFLSGPRLLGMGAVGLGLTALAAVKAGPRDRGAAALAALYAFSLPMLGVRWLLAPMLGAGPGTVLAMQAGTMYVAARGLLRLFAPFDVETVGAGSGAGAAGGEGKPLVYRPVPDQVVGLLEGTSRRRARPCATRADGTLDREAVSVVVPEAEAGTLAARVTELLAGKPFYVTVGGPGGKPGEVELVVRRSD